MVDSEKSSTFLTRLYSVLERPHVEYMIHWNQDGSGIVIKHPDDFSVLTLPSITGRSRFSDFVRQLDMYGFVRHVNNEQDIGDHDRDAGVWSHPKLRRQTTRDVVAAVTRRIVNRLPKPTQKQDSQEHISMTRSGAIYSSATDPAQTAIPDDGNDLPSESLLKELKFRDLADTFTPTEYKKIAQCYLNEGSDCWKTICTKTAFRTRTHQLEELCKRLESLYTEKWLQLKDIPIDALDNLTAENAHSIISTIARRDRAKSKTEVQAAPEFAGTSTERIGEKRRWEESSDDGNDYKRYLSQFKEQKGLPKKKSNNSSDSPSLASVSTFLSRASISSDFPYSLDGDTRSRDGHKMTTYEYRKGKLEPSRTNSSPPPNHRSPSHAHVTIASSSKSGPLRSSTKGKGKGKGKIHKIVDKIVHKKPRL